MCTIMHGAQVQRSDLFESAGLWLSVYIAKNLHLVRLVHLQRKIKRFQCQKIRKRMKSTE